MNGTLKGENILIGSLKSGGTLMGGMGGVIGRDGKSAYELAVKNGFKGTVEEWLESLKGEKGEAFEYSDFTDEQLAALKGEQGDPFRYEDFTDEQLAALKGEKGDKGDTFSYNDLTHEQIASLKGDKGDAFEYSDFTAEQLAALKGEKGDAFKYSDFTDSQLAALKGEKGDAFEYSDFTQEQLDSLKGETGNSGVYIGSEETMPVGTRVRIDPNGRKVEYAEKSYIVSVFEELKALIKAGNTDGAIAVLDEAILDLAVLA